MSSTRRKILPPVEIGECYAYKFDTGYRIIIILDRLPEGEYQEMVCCCILKKTYNRSELKDIDFLQEQVGFTSCYTANGFIAKSYIRKIGNIDVPENMTKKIFGKNRRSLSIKDSFKKDYSDVPPETLSELLMKMNENKILLSSFILKGLGYNPMSGTAPGLFDDSVENFNIYAIKSDSKYRIFALTEEILCVLRNTSHIQKVIFCYSWKDPFDNIPTFDELLKHGVMPLGYFKGETFPDMEKLTLIGNFLEMNILAEFSAEKINPAWEPSLKSLVLERHIYEEYPDEMCMKMEDVLAKAKLLKIN